MKSLHAEVLIIGGGFAGLNAAKCLSATGKNIVVIDRTNHHLFQPLLYQVATAGLAATDIAYPIREILKKHINISVVMADVKSIDRKSRTVVLHDGCAYTFDFLIVAVGVQVNFPASASWKDMVLPLKTLDDALRIRDQLLKSYEQAELSCDPQEIERLLTYVVIGGGATGVEVSGAISEIANKTLIRNFRRINSSDTRIFLLDAGDRVAAEFSERLSKKAAEGLRKLGVTVMTGVKVTDIDDNGVVHEKGRIEASNVIWAAGMRAPEILKDLDTSLDPMGRVLVRPDLTIEEDERIFVIGDAASVSGAEGNLPGTAPVAIQEGAHACRMIKEHDTGKRRRAFRYSDRGMLATIGKKLAIAQIGRLELSGNFAWIAWSLVHILYLICFRNRVFVFIHWSYYYFFGERGARIIHSKVDEP